VDIDTYNMILHDLKVPNAIIKNSADVIETYYDQGKLHELDLKHYLDSIRKNNHRIIKIVQNLLELHNQGYKKTQHANLHKIVSNLFKEFEKNEKGNQISFKVNKCDDLPLVACDIEQIERAFLNLISNSIKYGGKNIRAKFKMQDNSIIIRFENDSPKIPNELSEEIFKPFVRNIGGKTDIEGSGIGLAIVKKIIQEHNGKVYLDKDFKTGCAFIIELPGADKIQTLAHPRRQRFDLQTLINIELCDV